MGHSHREVWQLNPFKAMVGGVARGIMKASGWGPTPQAPMGVPGTPFVGGNWTGSKFTDGVAYPSQYTADFYALRQSARQARFESPQARALVGVIPRNTIGSGMSLELSPAWDIIDPQGLISEEGRRAWVKDVQVRYDLWKRSKECDASGQVTGYELESFEMENRLTDGETFPVIRHNPDPTRLSPVEVQFIQPDQVQTPPGKMFFRPDDTVRVVDGIEIDPVGREQAIHVRDPISYAFTRLAMRGPTRTHVLHPMLKEGIGQVRGMPLCAPFIHEIKKISDYSVAELEAAVINASIAAWVEPGDSADSSRPVKAGVQLKGGPNYVTQAAQNVQATPSTNGPIWDRPGLFLQALKKGEKLHSHDTSRPNVNAEAYIMGILKHMSASLGIAVEVLLQCFNANYSASRASIELTWNTLNEWAQKAINGFIFPVFLAWFEEEVLAARISAPGFSAPILRSAYTRCEFTGVRKPDIDPLKSANASILRQKAGHTTGEREALLFNGSNFDDNLTRLADENKRLAEVNEPLAILDALTISEMGQGDPLDEEESKDDQEKGVSA